MIVTESSKVTDLRGLREFSSSVEEFDSIEEVSGKLLTKQVDLSQHS